MQTRCLNCMVSTGMQKWKCIRVLVTLDMRDEPAWLSGRWPDHLVEKTDSR